LAGLKVSHDLDELAEGEEQILTLKDSRIIDNEGTGPTYTVVLLKLTHIVEDELQNVLAAEHARTEQRIQNKAKNREYSGYDDDEFTEGRAGIRKKVLAKYDEDIDGPQETVGLILIYGESRLYSCQGFRLGSSAKPVKALSAEERAAPATVNKDLLTIDYLS
jgi:U4/U6.U5 tri-snRNP-associated protein 1